MEENDGFETIGEGPSAFSPAAFVVDVEGFEGPIDILLQLARDQKVDITQISIVQLADQYLAFIGHAQRVNLELAADYLVMAAWLAYMKSRLLLPDLSAEGEPTGAEMAAALAFQLRRLEAMQDAGIRLRGRARLGQEFFARGAPERFATLTNTALEATVFDLMTAYGLIQRRGGPSGTLHIEPWELFTVEDALQRLRQRLGATPDWESLRSFLPQGLRDGLAMRSALASTFAASLELAREGRLELRQNGTFGPIYVRPANREGRAGPVAVPAPAGDGE